MVLWAANVLPDLDEVIKADDLDAKATDVHRLGIRRDRFKIANWLKVAEEIEVTKWRIKCEVAPERERLFVDLERKIGWSVS